MNSITIGLVGNPNCGKTTLFNALTGGRQRVGNWPGVTVERKTGSFEWQATLVEVVDLPGIYSLISVDENASVDERIACEYTLNGQADVIVNILDASHLERSLYVTLQLIEMRVPVILALNMMDVARQKNIRILLRELAQKLTCPVVALAAAKGQGIKELKQVIVQFKQRQSDTPKKNSFVIPYPAAMMGFIAEIANALPARPSLENKGLALRLLENDFFVRPFVPPALLQKMPDYHQKIWTACGEDSDILLADARYRFIHTVLSHCVVTPVTQPPTWTDYIDRVVLNRLLGIPIFLVIMYLMFLFVINIGGAFQDFFDISSHTIFVEGVAYGLTQAHAPGWLIALLANGVGKGISTTVTFIPVIGALFLFLAFLEDSGYMARAAFVVDRLMRVLGLPGKAFVPMIVGFGCNVPAVMAARTLENKRDRILAVLMTPFMSCGARLAIYAVFTAAFFPTGSQNIVFILYLFGIVLAMLTGFLLRSTLLQGKSAPLLLELPAYHLPHLKTLGLQAWQRLKGFVLRAGKLIVPICVVLGVLSSLTVKGTLNPREGDTHSLLAVIGRSVTPIFAPLGIQQNNWPATVGLLTGVLAKEVVIGTLNLLYSPPGHLANLPNDTWHLRGGVQQALLSIPANLSQLGSKLSHPVLAQAPVHSLSKGVYGIMAQRFDGQVGAVAYLLFVLLYFPCVSTTAAMLREVHRGWTLFSVIWTTGMAYGVAVTFYQLATWMRHPIASFVWVSSISSLFFLLTLMMRLYAQDEKMRGRYELA